MLSAVDTPETLSEEQNVVLKRTFSLSEIDNFTKLEKLAKQFVNMDAGHIDELMRSARAMLVRSARAMLVSPNISCKFFVVLRLKLMKR